MKKIYILLFIFSVANISISQERWNWYNPQVTGNNLYEINVIDPTTAVISGDAGTIIKSTDSGNSWTEYLSNSFKTLFTVSFANSITGYSGGVNSLLKTTDGGERWQQVVSNSDFQKIQVMDNVTLYRSLNGRIYRSTNSGLTFNIISGGNNSIQDFHFVDLNMGYFIFSYGNSTMFSKTTNGGQSWNQYQVSLNIDLKDLNIVNDNLFVACGMNGQFYYSIDGGEEWLKGITSVNVRLNSVSFKNNLQGIAVGAYGTILITNNGGRNWTQKYINVDDNLKDVKFLSDNIAIATGNKGVIIKTTNSGTDWTVISKSNYNYDLRGLSFINSETGFAVGISNKIIKTSNSGNTWVSNQILNLNHNYYGVKFLNNTTGFVVGEYGYIAKTINGGVTWEKRNSNSNYWLIGIDFLNASTGIAVGSSGKILKSVNEGWGWYEKNSNINAQIYDVQFIGGNDVIACAEGHIIKSTDLGETWFNIFTLNNHAFTGVKFVNANTGFFTATNHSVSNLTNGRVYKTTDAGNSWQVILSNVHKLNGIDFATEFVGAICGERGQVYKTNDGGLTWNLEYYADRGNSNFASSDPEYNFYKIKFAGDEKIFTAGSFGNIMSNKSMNSSGVNISTNIAAVNEFSLQQNYPNPFNPSTMINYELRNSNYVKLTIYDILGKEVTTLVNGKQNAGKYSVEWNASGFNSGIYFYKLDAQDYSEVKKMILMK